MTTSLSPLSSGTKTLPQHLSQEITALASLTRDLALSPYDPETWLNQANCLRVLGYPELGLGSAWKARLLIEAFGLSTTTDLGAKVTEAYEKRVYALHQTAEWARWRDAVATPAGLRSRSVELLKRLEIQTWTELLEGLMAANCSAEYLAMSREAVARFPEDEVFPSEVRNGEAWVAQREEILRGQVERGEMGEERMRETLRNGGVYPVAYPWMGGEMLVRSEKVVEAVQREFKKKSRNCEVQRSTIRNEGRGGEDESDIDVLGVIATRDINEGETILEDSTLAGVISSSTSCPTCCQEISQPHTTPCCETIYCSTTCSTLALSTFHPSLCGRDLASFYKAAEKANKSTDFELDTLLLLRVLALSKSESESESESKTGIHPLNTNLLSSLTPSYHTSGPGLIIFNFATHIVKPISLLLSLSICPFSNPSYDTWVLTTMRYRLQNNKHGQEIDGKVGTSISPLYAMFNHSCEPAADWRMGRGSEVVLFARRRVRRGEEVCISYFGGRELGVEERKNVLWPWLGRECGCLKCVREGEEEGGESA